MRRTLPVGLLALGLVFGYVAHGTGADAQSTASSRVPFRAGDTIRVDFEAPRNSRGGETCVIENFTDTFVICEAPNTEDLPVAYNLRQAYRITLLKKG